MTKIMNVSDFANDLLKANICAIPCKMPDKRPALDTWTEYESVLPLIGEHNFNGGLGIITGKISGNVFVLDVDIKYDISGTLLERLENEIGPELWDRIFQNSYIQKTVNNGLHIFLKCEEIEGNLKLARRYATDEEKAINPDEKVKVLLETRGEGGFIVVAPTPGYEVITGSLHEIGFVSIEDKERLFECCRFFNEVYRDVSPPTSKRFLSTLSGNLPPWEDYNERADVPGYLQSQGWTYFKTAGKNIHFSRPGKKGATSGTYCEELNLFRCFSTSTPLEGDKSYSPSALFTFLECGGNFEESARRLRAMGYGSKVELPKGTPPKSESKASTPLSPEQLKNLWHDRLITEEPEDDKPLLYIEKIPVLIEGNHTVVVGKKKSRKTLFLVWLLSKNIKQVLYFDTEQGRKHVWQVRHKVKQLNDTELPIFFLRGMSPKDRRDFIYQTVKEWPTRPQIVVIDGIRDLMSNINDPDESTNLIVWLESLIKDFNTGVVNVLHLNKTDNNARGHIGTELGNKSFMTIEMEKDDKTMVSIVKCADSRDEPFEDFAITHGADGLPELVSMPTKGKVWTEGQQKELLKFVFTDGLLTYGEFVNQVKETFEVGETKAKGLVATFTRLTWVMKNGKARDPKTTYKLMI